MAKSPDAFRTISEVADWLGVEAHVLRFWETKFTQVKPVKRAGGRRYYRPSDMALLGGIRRLLHDEGMTIRGVQKILREKGASHLSGLSPELKLDGPELAATPPRAAVHKAAEESIPQASPPSPAADPSPPPAEAAPTLPFDLPPAALHPAPAPAAQEPPAVKGGDGHANPEHVSGPAVDRPPRSVPMWVGERAVRLDPDAATEVLGRARALVERLRNAPE